MNIPDFLASAVKKNPDKKFLYYQEDQISYAAFQENIQRVAQGLHRLGIRRGDRVCVMLRNCPEFLYAWLALAHMGGILVPINTNFREKEVEYILGHSGAAGVLTEARFIPLMEEMKRIPGPRHWICEGREEAPGWMPFEELLRSPARFEERLKLRGDDISTIMYTSGTTGPPKGVLITHKMYIYCGEGYQLWARIQERDRLFTCLPLYHANAQYYSTMGSLAAGASLALAERFSASQFWEQVRKSGATIFNFIGAMLVILLKQPECAADRDHSIRLAYGAPALARPVRDYVEKRYGLTVISGYALTECPFGTMESPDGVRKELSMGRPRYHPRFKNHVRLVDDQDREVPPGTVGEITLRNPAVMKGYYKEPEMTRKALRGGWLHTGDNAWRDEEGYFYFVDRKKDVIRRRGENVSSIEVEGVLNAYPGVLESAVIGVPSEFSDEEIKAYIVPRPGESVDPVKLLLWCKEKLAYFKIPRYIEWRSSLPKTPTLRVEKYKLKSEKADLVAGCFDREKEGVNIRSR